MSVLHAGIATFLGASQVPASRAELEAAGATVAVLGLPDDTTTVTRPGASHGPRAIRDASSHFAFGETYHFDYDVTISEHETIVDCGDVDPVAGNVARTFERAEVALDQIHAAGAFPVLLGGDHAALIPGARAAARATGGKMGLVMLDTHLDTAPDIDGEELSHCTPVARTLDLDGVDGANVSIIGAHGAANPRMELDAARAHGVNVFSVRDIDRDGIEAVTRKALAAAADGTDGVYLSFDIDVLDGGFAWGTCGPEIGGITGRELVKSLEILSAANLVGMDCVEVSPFLDPSGNTARVGARAVIDVLAGRVVARRAAGAS
ncbi:MAG: agmatinase family protein [Actinobacteria bacterium]|nr:agmatinase family protein [Actinomycetota bacterium]